MLPVINILGAAVQVPGLVLLLGLWLGLTLAEKHASRHGINPALLYNLVFIGLLSGVIGARLAYVLRYPAIFAENLLGVFSLSPSLLDVWGGLAAALVALLAYGQRKQLPFWPTLDALVPLLAVFAVALGLSNLASGAAFGAPSDVPWSMELWGASRHPSQLYQSAAALAILAWVWPAQKPWLSSPPGQYFLTFAALSAAAALFLEAFRGDSLLVAGGLRLNQILAWIVLAVCLWGLSRLRHTLPSLTS